MSLTDERVKNQIQHMIAFIEQEANEKVEEIATKAEEECTNEASRIKQGQRVRITEYYKKKQNQMELNRRIQISNVQNNARLQILKVNEDHVKNILNETLKRLTSAIENPSEYKLLLQGLIAQGLFQLLVAKVEIKCRERDLALIQEVIPKAVEQYKAAAKKNVEVIINRKSYLSNDITGGVELTTLDGKMKVVNTLENRLELISEQILPELREILFGVNNNRKFRD